MRKILIAAAAMSAFAGLGVSTAMLSGTPTGSVIVSWGALPDVAVLTEAIGRMAPQALFPAT